MKAGKNKLKAAAFILWVLFLFSCAGYNRRIAAYYTNLSGANYQKAFTALDNNKLLQKSRNRLLYLLEKGKTAHLMKEYAVSNQFFNEADQFMEDARTSAKDIALGTLLNPMMQTYKGEDFEKYMVHYYKALNYLQLGKREEALVEARRISLRTNTQQDSRSGKNYTEDAFSFMLQGIIYEAGSDINNAFIAYRNAAEVYLKNKQHFYGTPMPLQLKKDVLRTAYLNGFTDQLERYEKEFQLSFNKSELPANGELVLFWENGLAPVKREQNLFFSLTKDGAGNFFFADATGSLNIPFDFSVGASRDDNRLNDLRTFRVAFPKYEEQPLFYNTAGIQVNEQNFSFEKAQNVNALAFETLRERMLKELAITLSRQAVKKLAEAAVRPSDSAKNKNEREAIAFALQVFNFASEKADTRNWQSLPHSIYYSRIPLKEGINKVTITLNGATSATDTLAVTGNKTVQVFSIATIR